LSDNNVYNLRREALLVAQLAPTIYYQLLTNNLHKTYNVMIFFIKLNKNKMNDRLLKTKLQSTKPPKLNQLTKTDLQGYFENTWELYEMLFSAIKKEETLYESPDPLRNPLIFYLGHTAAFYINKLTAVGLIKEAVNPHYDQLFAVGVDPDKPENLAISDFWPTIEAVKNYRKTIYNLVQNVIQNADLSDLPITETHPLWALFMAFEHDRIHFETSSVLIRQLPIDLVEKPAPWEYAPTLGNSEPTEWIKMDGGTVKIGKPNDADIYGWDNEYGELTVDVQAFKATKNLITNAEYLEFFATGNYENQALWSEEGWAWKTRTNTENPKFWIKNGSNFLYRAIFDYLEMPLDFPVEVNAHEARAYCNWKNDGSRLLSEAEFLLIAKTNTAESEDPLFAQHRHNLDFEYGSPTPVGYMKNGKTASGFNDIYGNVWDWLKDDFYPLNGYKVHPLYTDFSAPYMDNEHSMMAGGAWATTGTAASKYYRLWFRRHFYQHAGFRLAKSC
jgi:5-histidylcysteine sulfoxide synthase